MKVPIDFDKMLSVQLLSLARKCIREFNDNNLQQFKIVEN